MSLTNKVEIAVIGGGVVGVATALRLQLEGYRVLLIERAHVAAGASFGNAGTLAPYGVLPIAQPSLPAAIPSLLFSSASPFVINWKRLPRLMPWLLRFLGQCSNAHFQHNATALNRILQRVYEGYAPLLEACPEAASRLSHGGCLYSYASKAAFAAAEPAIRLRESFGIAQQRLTGDEVAGLEPVLAGHAAAGLLFPDSSHLDDPSAFVEALAKPLYATASYLNAAVERVQPTPDGLLVHCAAGQQVQAGRVVVCSGAWSQVLARQLGDRIPLETERGYHLEFDLDEMPVSRPCCPVESAFYMTPMAGRLRIAGTVELGSLHDPANPRRFDYLEQHARRVLGLQTPVARKWLGFRPSLPDSLPVIGPASQDSRVIYAFGHQHLGLTLAGATAALVTACVAGTAPEWLSDFSAKRF